MGSGSSRLPALLALEGWRVTAMDVSMSCVEWMRKEQREVAPRCFFFPFLLCFCLLRFQPIVVLKNLVNWQASHSVFLVRVQPQSLVFSRKLGIIALFRMMFLNQTNHF